MFVIKIYVNLIKFFFEDQYDKHFNRDPAFVCTFIYWQSKKPYRQFSSKRMLEVIQLLNMVLYVCVVWNLTSLRFMTMKRFCGCAIFCSMINSQFRTRGKLTACTQKKKIWTYKIIAIYFFRIT